MEVEVVDIDLEVIRHHLNNIIEQSGMQTSLITIVTLTIEQMKLNDVELVSVRTPGGGFEGYLKPLEH